MHYLYSLTIAFFLTVAIIPLLIALSSQMGLVDMPVGGRKLHQMAMPRTGGLGIILGASIPLFFLLPDAAYSTTLLPSCAIIVVFGLLDDRFELNYKWKLFGQSLAALSVMSGGIVFQQVPLLGFEEQPMWLSWCFTYFFLIGVVNGVNFSDGLDGLAGGTSIMALLLLFIFGIHTGNEYSALVALTFVGAVMGFLRYNTYPARLFMGDAGSQFLGFLIACLTIIITQSESSAISSLIPFLILGIPIMDILQVVPVRIHKRLPLPGPDNEHFHHQLVKLGFRHYEVVTIIYLLQALLMCVAYMMRFESDLAIGAFYLLFVSLICSTIYLANVFGWKFRQKVRRNIVLERRNKLLRKIGWLYRHLAKVISILTVLYFCLSLLFISPVGEQLSRLILLLAVSLIVASIFARKQRSVITRVSSCLACILIAYLLSLSGLSQAEEILVTGLLAFLAIFLLLSIRMTRSSDFSFDTLDLLLLLGVVFLPLLPFEALSFYSVSRIALTTFIILYAVEFTLNTGQGSVVLLNVGAIGSLLVIGFLGVG